MGLGRRDWDGGGQMKEGILVMEKWKEEKQNKAGHDDYKH
jgi:hypothetical protein